MAHFRDDNTEGYDAAALAELNAAFDKIMAQYASAWSKAAPVVRVHYKSWQDHIGEVLQYLFDQGVRGDNLVNMVDSE